MQTQIGEVVKGQGNQPLELPLPSTIHLSAGKVQESLLSHYHQPKLSTLLYQARTKIWLEFCRLCWEVQFQTPFGSSSVVPNIAVLADNTADIAVANQEGLHARTKHTDVKYHHAKKSCCRIRHRFPIHLNNRANCGYSYKGGYTTGHGIATASDNRKRYSTFWQLGSTGLCQPFSHNVGIYCCPKNKKRLQCTHWELMMSQREVVLFRLHRR